MKKTAVTSEFGFVRTAARITDTKKTYAERIYMLRMIVDYHASPRGTAEEFVVATIVNEGKSKMLSPRLMHDLAAGELDLDELKALWGRAVGIREETGLYVGRNKLRLMYKGKRVSWHSLGVADIYEINCHALTWLAHGTGTVLLDDSDATLSESRKQLTFNTGLWKVSTAEKAKEHPSGRGGGTR